MPQNELCLKEIGHRIMERRKKLGLTQEALANMVTPASVPKRASRMVMMVMILMIFFLVIGVLHW